MTDIIEIISSAYKSYSANYQKVLSAFAIIAVITFVASMVSSLSNLSDRFDEKWCAPENLGKLPFTEYCGTSTFASIVLGLADFVISFIGGIITTIIVFAAYKPLGEILSGGPVSSWQQHLSSQVGNTLRLYLLLLAQFLVVVFVIMLGASIIYFSGLNWIVAAVVVIVGIILLLLMGIGFALAFTFVNVELVFSKKGIVDAVNSSYALVKKNLANVFLFHLVWLMISIAVGLATLITCCLSIFLDPIVSCMILLPIRMLSEIVFWKQLKMTP